MMNLEELIQPDSVLCNVSARSKKHCLEVLSELLTRANPDIANEEIFARLIERERLGCTSLDKGVAFPHCRINGLRACSAALMKLSDPVDFGSTDGESVDLVFGMILPQEISEEDRDNLQAFSALLRDKTLIASLREAKSSRELMDALMLAEPQPLPAAAVAEQG